MQRTEVGSEALKAAAFIKRGAVIALPTETLYGLAADACNSAAVLKVYALKKRPLTRALTVQCASFAQAFPFVRAVPDFILPLLEKWMPGPITLLLEKKPSVLSPYVAAHSRWIGIRVPGHPLAQALLQALDVPVVVPSANMFGQPPAVSAQEVRACFDRRIPYILDGGVCALKIPSTTLSCTQQPPAIYIHRRGVVSEKDIQMLCPDVRITTL